jgi:DNA-binding FrmR family transcriptional regulator
MQESSLPDILARLKSVEGHVRGVQRMVTEGAYCMDIIKQNLAIQRALEKVNSMVLDGHLNTCVTTAIRGDDPAERERVIREILQVFEMTTKL